jgi:S-formylglutathione hydrolase FrmB
MANHAGVAFDCAVVRGGTAGGLYVHLHQRQGSLLGSLAGSNTPGEWVLAMDDHLPNGEDTFWYGYHEDYDVTSTTNVPPTAGVVRDYTLRRALHTLEWARRNFPVDTTRVYAYGYSMGGIGSMLLAYRRPDLIAAVLAICGKVDFSFVNDPDSSNFFNAGGRLRGATDQLWGEVATNLPTNDGMPVYARLNDGVLNGMAGAAGLPPILAFNGRHDTTVGWAEKIGWYQSLQSNRLGGYEYWDLRDHTSAAEAAWEPMQDMQFLYRFRTTRSFPALSNGSPDGDPGDGNAAIGDSVGGFNVFVRWDTTVVDQPATWATTFTIRYVSTKWGPVPLPDSLRVDVTPRRAQAFKPAPGQWCDWEVRRSSDQALLESGAVRADSLGLVTIPAVPIQAGGVRLTITRDINTGVEDNTPAPRLALALSRNPVLRSATVDVRWPGADQGRVDLLDVCGRRVTCLWKGRTQPGPARIVLDASRMPGGVYFVVAHAANERVTRRVVVLH